MQVRMWSLIAVVALLFGFASTASAQERDKSWDVDVYRDGADVTYIDDGYDDVNVYDHNNHNNDRTYYSGNDNRYDDRRGYRDGGGYGGVAVQYYDDDGYRGGYGGGRGYGRGHHHARPYVRYHRDYDRRGHRGW